MTFLEVKTTCVEGYVYINVEKITSLTKMDGLCVITLDNGHTYRVNRTPEYVLERLNQLHVGGVHLVQT